MQKAKIRQNECVACGCCAKHCPKSAINIHNGKYAQVDKNLCIGCEMCKNICPASVIEMEVTE